MANVDMSMRDEFAVQALLGLMYRHMPGPGIAVGQDIADELAQAAYLFADAMLKARKPKEH